MNSNYAASEIGSNLALHREFLGPLSARRHDQGRAQSNEQF